MPDTQTDPCRTPKLTAGLASLNAIGNGCQKVNQLIVANGHAVVGKKRGEPLRGRWDSFAAETDVHFPTDVNLLWESS